MLTKQVLTAAVTVCLLSGAEYTWRPRTYGLTFIFRQ